MLPSLLFRVVAFSSFIEDEGLSPPFSVLFFSSFVVVLNGFLGETRTKIAFMLPSLTRSPKGLLNPNPFLYFLSFYIVCTSANCFKTCYGIRRGDTYVNFKMLCLPFVPL